MKSTTRVRWQAAIVGSTILAAAPALLAAAAYAPAPAAADGAKQGGEVKFQSGVATLAVLANAAERGAAITALIEGGAARHVVVQFSGPLMPAQRGLLAKNGLTLQSTLGDHAYFATLAGADGVRAADLAAFEPLRSIAAVERTWKLHSLFVENAPLPWAEVPVQNADPADPIIGVYVLFHADAPMGLDAVLTAQKHGGNVRIELMTVPGLVVEMPRSRVEQLADEDSVQWIEPAGPKMSGLMLRNDSNRVRVGADLANAAPYNLDGTGITAFIYDSGAALSTHVGFGGRLTRIDSDTTVSHSTHVAGTVGGSGAGSTPSRAGMAPNVTLVSAGLEWAGAGTFLYDNPGDVEADYNTAINSFAADIANNSIGTNVSTNNFDCALQGNYGLTDSIIDNIVRGSLGRPFRIVWANGNERQSTRCNVEGHGQYYSIAPPSTAKNHLTVGALNSNDDSMTSFSSWGPTDDGRMKPDISGPGCQSGGDNTVTSTTSTSNVSYGGSCGTSMSSPTIAGVGVLILQDFRARFPGVADPRNSMLRALLSHTAVDIENPGPDYKSGYGSVRTIPAIDQMRSGQLQEATVGQGETFSTTIVVAGGGPLKVTMAWDDFAGTPNAAVALVNDLDLRLIDPSGTPHMPWSLDPLSPATDAVRTGPNRRDNIEQVMVDSPMPGAWTVEVTGFNVPQGPQTFSIVGAGQTTGVIITPLTEIPTLVLPGVATTVDVSIQAVNQTLIEGSANVHYRLDGGSFTALPLVHVAGDVFRAVLPVVSCGDTLDFYFSAAGTFSGPLTTPSGAPDVFYSTGVGSDVVPFADSFDTNSSWTVTDLPAGTGLFTGSWIRAVPVPATGTPLADAEETGAGFCFVTDNRSGNFDIDNGTTILTSPTLDASGGEARVSYQRWFFNLNGLVDTLRVEISGNNGGSWTVLEQVGPSGPDAGGGWRSASHVIPAALATDQFRIRFTASDLADASIVEAGIDAFQLNVLECTEPTTCPADWSGDGTVNSSDISAFLTSWLASVTAPNLVADFNQDGTTNSSDISAFLTAWLDAVTNGC